jgi:hypothetical protein
VPTLHWFQQEQTLDEFLGLTDRDFVALIRTGQEQAHVGELTTCMSAEGFFYLPIDDVQPWYEELSPVEFAEIAGFGVVESFQPTLYDSSVAEQTDPNMDYRAGLPAGDRLRYDAALLASGGCMEQANDATYGKLQGLWSLLREPLAEAADATMSTDVYAAATEVWHDCMVSRGIVEFDTPAAVHRWVVISLTAQAQAVALAGTSDELLEIRRREVEVAAPYYACTLDLEEAMLPIRRKFEWQIIQREIETVSSLKQEYRRFADAD